MPASQSKVAERIAAAVDGDRLWQRVMDLAEIGATPGGGVNRQALTKEDAQAQALLMRWAEGRSFHCFTDEIGNIFIRKVGTNPRLPVVMAGSHLDSQPSGGRFDGVYGVLAAFEVLETLADLDITTQRHIDVVAWCNEEGCRFDQGCMGSQVFTDPTKLPTMLALKDSKGVSVRSAIAEMRKLIPSVAVRPADAVRAYLEAHIEQGPVLEQTRTTIGVVTGMQGSRRFWIEIRGEDAHAGTVPHAQRKDALFAANDIIAGLRELMADPSDIVRFTIGRFDVSPNGPSVVPGYVAFTIDFRHTLEAVLTELGDQIEPICVQQKGPCSVTVTETRRAPVRIFDGIATRALRIAAARSGFSHMDIPSGAGHDARFLASICDTGMIFVPCEKGISHNVKENAQPSDLVAGTKVLADAIYQLTH